VESGSPFAHSAIKNAGNFLLHATTTASKYGSPNDWLEQGSLSLDLDV